MSIKATLGPNIISTLGSADLTTAYGALKKAQARHAVVLNEKKEIIGVLSARDLEKADRSADRSDSLRVYSFEPDQKAQNFMSTSVQVVLGNSPLTALSQRMIDEGVAAYLISDQGMIKGVVSCEDLLIVLHQLLLQVAPESSQLEDRFFNATIDQYLEKPNDFET